MQCDGCVDAAAELFPFTDSVHTGQEACLTQICVIWLDDHHLKVKSAAFSPLTSLAKRCCLHLSSCTTVFLCGAFDAVVVKEKSSVLSVFLSLETLMFTKTSVMQHLQLLTSLMCETITNNLLKLDSSGVTPLLWLS